MEQQLILALARAAGLEKALAEFPDDVAAAAAQALNNAGGDPCAGRSGRGTVAADARRSRTVTAAALAAVSEAARAFAERTLSPVELLSACWSGSEKLDPLLHAFIRLDADAAMDAARAAEKEIAAGTLPRSAARRADRREGHHRRRRPADDMPLEDPAGQRGAAGRGGDRAAARRPAPSSSASCRRMNSPLAARASTCRSRLRAIRGTRSTIRAARRQARARGCVPGCFPAALGTRYRRIGAQSRPAPAASSG